ncbi:MAG TPA: LytTR family DNA-binding domain-containing protein [Cyclobacteriaceae bacterium]|nr:LytTR family DNA-binding domain-containing protein [Cyclobacteriaceae bacterium]
MKLSCLIVEDEPIGQEIIRSYIERIGFLEIRGQFKNALEAFTWLQSNTVEVLFLDIKMPRMSGLEMLRALPERPKAIITSAYRDYAIDAFDLDVVDYLLKPIAFDRFMRAVNKIRPDTTIRESKAEPAPEKPFLFVKGNKQLQKVYIDDILYIESQRDYVKIRLAGNAEVITRQTISYYEEFLPAQLFLRIHRSFIVATRKVTAFEPTRLLIGDLSVPIGRNYKQTVADHLRTVM